MRFVLDTNLLVSGLLWGGGLPRQLINSAKAGQFELCTSEVLLAELHARPLTGLLRRAMHDLTGNKTGHSRRRLR